MKAYGMDVARHTEGRRYRVASRQYKAVDGSNRSRIRYTVAGPRGKAYVYAEVRETSVAVIHFITASILGV